MLHPKIAAGMLDASLKDQNNAADASLDDPVTLHERTVDALKGRVTMVDTAEPAFLPFTNGSTTFTRGTPLPWLGGFRP